MEEYGEESRVGTGRGYRLHVSCCGSLARKTATFLSAKLHVSALIRYLASHDMRKMYVTFGLKESELDRDWTICSHLLVSSN